MNAATEKVQKNLQNSFYSNKLTVMNQILVINTDSNIYMSETQEVNTNQQE